MKKQTQRKILLFKVTREEVEWWLAEAVGKGKWGVSVFNRYRISSKVKTVEMDSGDGCTTMLMYLMPQNCTMKTS